MNASVNAEELYGKYRKLAEPKFDEKPRGFLGIFGSEPEKKELPPMAFEDAFFVVLLGAAKADGHIRREEEDQIRLVTSRAPTFANMSTAKLGEYHLKASQWMYKIGMCDIVGAACDTIKKEDENVHLAGTTTERRVEAVFALAADIAFVDRAFEEKEKQFINALATRLGIEDKRRDDIVGVMRVKNAF